MKSGRDKVVTSCRQVSDQLITKKGSKEVLNKLLTFSCLVAGK
jgi:hypothetical protein